MQIQMKLRIWVRQYPHLKEAEQILNGSTGVTILLEYAQNRDQLWDWLARHGFQCYVWDCTKRILKQVIFDEVAMVNSLILRRQPWVMG